MYILLDEETELNKVEIKNDKHSDIMSEKQIKKVDLEIHLLLLKCKLKIIIIFLIINIFFNNNIIKS